MPELHELLAVEGDLKGEKDKIREETGKVFGKKEAYFQGKLRKLKMFDEARKQEETEERSSLVTTVKDKLDYMSKSSSRYWDLRLQKESANQEAKANIVIDGKTIAENVPVVFLLSMEEELKQLRKLYDTIPTLAPGVEWEKDPIMGDNIWKSKHPIETLKTEKKIDHKIIVPATEHHPAQVSEWTDDRPVGKYISETWCGMLSPAEKSIMLGKIDKVLRAIKKARQRANNQEVKKLHIGSIIFDYIHN